jgi:hypothetical protein
MMRHLLFALALTISAPLYARSTKTMVCHDAEFGAGHLKIVIADTKGFFSPREQKPMVKGVFWIKGEMYTGVLEDALFMPDWSENAGWYRSTPSPLNFSMCNWRKCPVRKVKLMVHTKDSLKAEGNIKFIVQNSDKERLKFDRKLNCELK